MTCEHKHLKCVNCVFICMDCGAKVDPPKTEQPEPTEKPKRTRAKKGAAK